MLKGQTHFQTLFQARESPGIITCCPLSSSDSFSLPLSLCSLFFSHFSVFSFDGVYTFIYLLYFKDFIHVLEKGEGRERNITWIDCLSTAPSGDPGTCPYPYRTCYPSVLRLLLNSLSHSGQGLTNAFYSFLKYILLIILLQLSQFSPFSPSAQYPHSLQ